MSEILTRALFEALSKRDSAKALECIEKGAYMDRTVKSQNITGISALHLACAFGLKEVVVALLAKDHNVHRCNSLGWTPMHEAAKAGHLDIVQLLHHKGANISVKTDKGANVLHLAVVHDRFDVGVYALQATEGRLLYEADEAGDTPLHLAIILERSEFSSYFLNNCYVKELLNTKGSDGELPLHLQVTADPASPLIEQLIDSGANPRLLNKELERPSQLAQRYKVTSKYLREKEFPLFYLCCKKIVQEPELFGKAKEQLPEIVKSSLDNVKQELDSLVQSMSKLKINA
ncbi:MAG: ankyrin repeat domain-containing protein [Proteobacteria bacterium]|nr:ankyrin repeat domain-containing protein [Pseudomonadota bacterium]